MKACFVSLVVILGVILSARLASAEIEQTPLTITCPSGISQNNDHGKCGAIVTYSPPGVSGGFPFFEGEPYNVSSDPPSGSFFAVGTTTVTCSASDRTEQKATCTFTVTVKDTEAPTIFCPADVTNSNNPGQCFASLNPGSATAIDNCDVGVSALGSRSDQQPLSASYPVGTTTITWTAIDKAGNQSACTQAITVTDAEAPKLVCPADITSNNDSGQCFASLNSGSATATDNCDGAVTPVGSRNDQQPLSAPYRIGTTTITWTAVDKAGNQSSCTQRVTVTDGEGPKISCPADVTRPAEADQCSAAVDPGTATATDNCDGAVTPVGSRSDEQSLTAPYRVGTTTITWIATDKAGNQSSCTQRVTVTDAEAPKITCPADIARPSDSGQCAATFNPGAATATDNCDGAVSPIGSRSDGQPLSAPYAIGTTTVTWTATDKAGNQATCPQVITVTDAEAPKLSCPPDITRPNDSGQCSATVNPGTATATDNCDQAVTPAGSRSDGQPLSASYPVGTTTINWNATDKAGNQSSCTQKITVTDAEAPKVVCPADVTSNNDSGQCSATLNPGAATATDNCDRAVTPVGSRSDEQPLSDSYPVGTTVIRWTATDKAGNQSACTQTITVTDNEAPKITCPANITTTIEFGQNFATVVIVPATATDNCSSDVLTGSSVSPHTVFSSGVPVVGVRSDNRSLTDSYPAGTTTITWTATDAYGNSASCTQTVTVGVPCTSLDPTSLDFGNQTFEIRSAPQSVTVRNSGTAPLQIDGAAITGDRDFSITSSGGGATLAPGAALTITVVFTPIVVGERRATLSISDNSSCGPHSVALIGTGTNPSPINQPPPLPTIQPQSLGFSDQQVGTISAPKSVVVTNSAPVSVNGNPGGPALSISSITIAGANPSDFVLVTGVGSGGSISPLASGKSVANNTAFSPQAISAGDSIPPLVPGKSASINIAFAPKAVGLRTANLLIATNASPNVYVVTLNGNGTPPIEQLLQVTRTFARSTPAGLQFFSNNPPGPESNDFTAVRGVGPDGSLLLVDWAGTALVQLPPPFNTTPPSLGQVLIDPANPPPPDGVGLARLLRVEVSPSGVDSVAALRADNNLGIYRFANGNLTLLGQILDPRGDRQLAIGDAGQIAYVANVDPDNPDSPLALYQATATGLGRELLREGGPIANIGGATIDDSANPNNPDAPRNSSFSDLTGNSRGILSVLVRLRFADGSIGFAVLRRLEDGTLQPLAVTRQTIVEKGRGTGVTGVLTDLRRPRLGPDGSILFLGAGLDFVNFYQARPDGTLVALLAAPGTDRTIIDGNPEPGSSGRRFDYEIAADGTVGLQVALASPADSTLLLVAPAGQVTRVAGGQPNLEPILPPVFGPGGRVFFLAEDRTLPTDRNGRYQTGLYRYRPEGTALEPVAKPGPNQGVPGWPPDTQLLGISQRPVITGNNLLFGVLFGGPQPLPVPTTALFQVPLDGTLATEGTLVATEGHPENNANRLAMLRDLAYQTNRALVAYGLLPGAGPVITPASAPASAAAAFHTKAQAAAPPIIPLVADGDPLGQGKLINVIPPLLAIPPDRNLFGARTSRTQTLPHDWDHEGLFTSKREQVAETTQAVTQLADTIFNGFADAPPLLTLGPASVAVDGRMVFKALLAQNKSPLAGIFEWATGGQPTLIMAAPDPRALLRWAAGKAGRSYILVKPPNGVGQLFVSESGRLPTPVSPNGLTDLTDLALNSSDEVFVVGRAPNGSGVFQLFGPQYTPITVAIKGTAAPPKPSELGTGYTFESASFKLAPDSIRGSLIFRATVTNGREVIPGEFQFDGSSLATLGVGGVFPTGVERKLVIGTLGSTLPSQSRSGITVSARLHNNLWSLVLFHGNSLSGQTIAQDGQKLLDGSQIKVLDAGALLQQETDPEQRIGPVFTISDQGDVAFLASTVQGWGVYQVPAAPTVPAR